MFDLMRMITESENEIPPPMPATLATPATKHEPRGFSLCDTLATSCDTESGLNGEQEFVTACHNLSQSQKHAEGHKKRGLSQMSQVSQPSPLNFAFLTETPFTKAMILEGLARWQEPFDQIDLDEIASGELTIEQARKYLFIWARQNPEQYKTLRSLTCARNSTAPSF